MKYNKKGESRIEISDILDYFKDINSMYNDCLRHDSLKRMLEDLVAETREDVELERKTGKWVHGKLIYSDISIATCTTCGKRVPVGNFCMDCGSYNGEKEVSAQPATSCSEFPNTSDVVSRKAVRKMVSAWAYDLMEQEDLNMALHDVDELPSVQPEVIHCKDCKHYRTTGAFGVPLHKEEYFCDADNYPKNDPGKEQRELPEWWFCAGAERKENGYTLDCQTCDLENPSGFKMRDRFTTVPKDVYEKMQMVDLREEQEERIVASPIIHPLKGE